MFNLSFHSCLISLQGSITALVLFSLRICTMKWKFHTSLGYETVWISPDLTGRSAKDPLSDDVASLWWPRPINHLTDVNTWALTSWPSTTRFIDPFGPCKRFTQANQRTAAQLCSSQPLISSSLLSSRPSPPLLVPPGLKGLKGSCSSHRRN